MYKSFFKSILDFLLSFIAFILLSPLFLVITGILLVVNQGKPFFFQARAGLNGAVFPLIKFKTMNDLRGKDNELLPDHERMTTIGNFVRKTSMDELPQLINVMRGEMSLIGPRPFLAEYLSIYTPEEMERFKVKPGITGWAQINGRNQITWKEKFKLDIWYVQNLSYALDFKIVILTIKRIFKGEGISGDGHVTSEKYNGNN
ncbi:MAG: sugar transferase [Bacteroidota bacterium]